MSAAQTSGWRRWLPRSGQRDLAHTPEGLGQLLAIARSNADRLAAIESAAAARSDALNADLERLSGIVSATRARLASVESSADRRAADTTLVDEVRSLRKDVWHSKVVNLGSRLLVGCRHLDLIYIMDPADRLIGPRFVLDGEYEPETSRFFLERVQPDSVCIDVGANFGYYTCLFAQLAWKGKVLSFEPDPDVFDLLRSNVLINWCEHTVVATNAAVGRSNEPLVLYRTASRSGNTGLIRPSDELLQLVNEVSSEAFETQCVTLDSLLPQLDRVDFIKIDVEGAEALVLEGMTELIRLHRPTIVMEWSPWQTVAAGQTIERVGELLHSAQLTPHVIARDSTLRAVTVEELLELPYQNVVLQSRT